MPAAKSKAHAVPEGYQAVMPYLRVHAAADAIAFYKKAFGAKERFRLTMGDRIGHAELNINGCVVMLSDEFPEMDVLGPKALKGTTITLMLQVADCDAAMKKAVAAGAKITRPATDEFYGDRTGQVQDPFGHVWMIQQNIETVTPKEMQKRLDQMMADPASEPTKKTSSNKKKG
jgi:PhnB protein